MTFNQQLDEAQALCVIHDRQLAAPPLVSLMRRESHRSQRVNNGALRQGQSQVVCRVRSELAPVQTLMVPFKKNQTNLSAKQNENDCL